MKIVSSAPIRADLRERLQDGYPQLSFCFHTNIHEAAADLRDADVLITYGEDLTPEMVKRAEHLKWIMVISAGLDRLPFSAIKEKGIMVTNARGIHKIPMAEYVFAAILQWAKKTKNGTNSKLTTIGTNMG